MEQPLLRLENVSKYYVNGKNVVVGLQQVSLTFRRGEFVAVTGESGSGKSTLGRILAGILPYESGQMYVNSSPTSHFDTEDWESYRRQQVAFISQDYGILPGVTVWDHVLSALRMSGISSELWEEKGRQILETVELWDLRRRRGGKLSSGQKQRLAIARAMAKPSSILVADEPTGNLDRENSQKVLQLLALTAKERLVILITHEFSEAEPYVTRHISLHDGSVSTDAALRAPMEVEIPARVKTRDRGLIPYVAGLQLRSRPVWTAIMLLLFSLTAFAVFAFLGTFLSAVDDTSIRVYSSEAFLNGDKERIVAVRKDGAGMTAEDFEKILAIKQVVQIEPYGYVRDMFCAWREGVDYVRHHTVYNYGSSIDPLYTTVDSLEILNGGSFVQTIPVVKDSAVFLTAGSLPQRIDQVVMTGSPEQIGQTVTVYLQDSRQWARDAYIEITAQVVGVTDQDSGIYFHESVGKMLTLAYLGAEYVYMPVYDDVYSRLDYVNYLNYSTKSCFRTDCVPTAAAVLRPMEAEECLISHRMYRMLMEDRTFGEKQFMQNMDTYDFLYHYSSWDLKSPANRVVGLHTSTLHNLLGVRADVFEALIASAMEGSGDQVSLTITDYAYTQRVIDALEQAGYYAVSPYVIGSVGINEELAAKREQTLQISLSALVAVLVLQILLLWALFSVQTASYSILSHQGLPCGAAVKSVLLQVIGFTALGQLLGGAGIGICSGVGVERIVNISKYVSFGGWLAMGAVHLLGALLTAVLVLTKLRKEVYPASKRTADLVLDDEEVSGHD